MRDPENFKETVEKLFEGWTPVIRLSPHETAPVWEVKHTGSNVGHRVIKVIPTSRLKTDRALKEFIYTLEASSKTDNICTVHLFMVSDDNKYVFLLMDYLDPIDIPNSGAAKSMVVRLGLDILVGLQGLHESGIAHMDIKPQNIMVSEGSGPNRHYKLIDLGLAHEEQAAENGRSFIRVGTEAYMAPEIYHNSLPKNGSINLFLCDIYSLGVTMYKLLNNKRLPYQENILFGDKEAIARRMEKDPAKREPLPPPLYADAALTEFLRKMMAYDPKDRYQSAHEALEALMPIYNALENDKLFKAMHVPLFPEERKPTDLSIPVDFQLRNAAPVVPDYPGVAANRADEIAAIREDLGPDSPVFVNGAGGMGKTTVALEAARGIGGISQNFLIHYDGTMRQTIANLEFINHEFHPSSPDLSVAQYEKEKYDDRINVLRRYYSRALIIVDGFDSETRSFDELRSEDEYMDLIGTRARFIFTTRFSDPNHKRHHIGALSDEMLLELMRHYAPNCNLDEDELRAIITATGGHTLTLVLIAKSIRASHGRLMPRQVLEALSRADGDSSLPEVTSDYNRGPRGKATILSHLKALFDISGLPAAARRVMVYASLLPHDGMEGSAFCECLRSEEEECVDQLIQRGWLEEVGETPAVYKMHDIINTVFRKQLLPEDTFYASFLSRLKAKLRGDPEELLLPAAAVFSNAALNQSADNGTAKDGWRSESASLYLKAGRFHEAIARDLLCLPVFKNGERSVRMIKASTQNPAFLCDSQQEKDELAKYFLNRLLHLSIVEPAAKLSVKDLTDRFSREESSRFLEDCNTLLHQLRNLAESSDAVCSFLADVYARMGMNTSAICYISQGLQHCGNARLAAPAASSLGESGFLSVMAEVFKNEGNLRKQYEYTLAAVRQLQKQNPASPDFEAAHAAGHRRLQLEYIRKCCSAGLLLCQLKDHPGAAALLQDAEAVMHMHPELAYRIPEYDALKHELGVR